MRGPPSPSPNAAMLAGSEHGGARGAEREADVGARDDLAGERAEPLADLARRTSRRRAAGACRASGRPSRASPRAAPSPAGRRRPSRRPARRAAARPGACPRPTRRGSRPGPTWSPRAAWWRGRATPRRAGRRRRRPGARRRRRVRSPSAATACRAMSCASSQLTGPPSQEDSARPAAAASRRAARGRTRSEPEREPATAACAARVVVARGSKAERKLAHRKLLTRQCGDGRRSGRTRRLHRRYRWACPWAPPGEPEVRPDHGNQVGQPGTAPNRVGSPTAQPRSAGRRRHRGVQCRRRAHARAAGGGAGGAQGPRHRRRTRLRRRGRDLAPVDITDPGLAGSSRASTSSSTGSSARPRPRLPRLAAETVLTAAAAAGVAAGRARHQRDGLRRAGRQPRAARRGRPAARRRGRIGVGGCSRSRSDRARRAAYPGLAVTVVRPAMLVGSGEPSVFTRHFEAPRLLVVRGSTPRWQFCTSTTWRPRRAGRPRAGERRRDLGLRRLAPQDEVEALSGMRRIELPARSRSARPSGCTGSASPRRRPASWRTSPSRGWCPRLLLAAGVGARVRQPGLLRAAARGDAWGQGPAPDRRSTGCRSAARTRRWERPARPWPCWAPPPWSGRSAGSDGRSEAARSGHVRRRDPVPGSPSCGRARCPSTRCWPRSRTRRGRRRRCSSAPSVTTTRTVPSLPGVLRAPDGRRGHPHDRRAGRRSAAVPASRSCTASGRWRSATTRSSWRWPPRTAARRSRPGAA